MWNSVSSDRFSMSLLTSLMALSVLPKPTLMAFMTGSSCGGENMSMSEVIRLRAMRAPPKAPESNYENARWTYAKKIEICLEKYSHFLEDSSNCLWIGHSLNDTLGLVKAPGNCSKCRLGNGSAIIPGNIIKSKDLDTTSMVEHWIIFSKNLWIS